MSVIGGNGPRLLTEKCDTCIFRPGNLMHLRRGRVKEMVESSLDDGGFITCHKTLSYGEHPGFGEAVCRGFFDAHGPRSQVLRSWMRIGPFDEVSPPVEAGVSS